MGPNILGTVGGKGCKGQFPRINGDTLTSRCDRACGGTKTVGIPEFVLDVTNPVEPTPQPPPTPPPPPGAVPLKAVAGSPANGATGVFPSGLVLVWANGGGAESYSVWINNVLYSLQAETTFVFPSAGVSTIYWWRIDSLNENGLTTGDIWAFQTAATPVPPPPVPPAKPVNVSPVNGSVTVDPLIATTLTWADGGGAISYDVYLNGVFQVNQLGTSYPIGFLTPLTVYTWRIDSVNFDGTTAGDTWTFTTTAGLPPAPGQATIVSPANGDTAVTPGVVTLTWTNGGGATSYDVYFDGVFQGNQAGTTFNTPTLGSYTPHTWQIDSANAGGTTAGALWTFSTAEHATTTAWAAQVVTNGGAAVSTATRRAVSDFCFGLDSASLTASMKAVNCFVPDNLIASITPLIKTLGIDPWTNTNFVGGDLTVNGLKGNAVNKYLTTGVIPFGNLAYTSLGVTVYAAEDGGVGDERDFGSDGENPTYDLKVTTLFVKNVLFGSICAWDCPYAAGVGRVTGGSPGMGYYSGNRVSTTDSRLFFASSVSPHAQLGATNTFNTGANTTSDKAMTCFAYNYGGTIVAYASKRLSFVAVHLGLSSAQSANLFNAVQALRTALGGGFV